MQDMYYLLCYDFKYGEDDTFGDRVYSDCAAGKTVIEAWNHFLEMHKDSGKTYRLLGARPDIYPDNISDTAQWEPWYDAQTKFRNNVAYLTGQAQEKNLIEK
jgi:hypothetical protein